MSVHKHERLAQLLGQGARPDDAIKLVGMSTAYYNRLKDTDEFVRLLQIEINSEKLDADDKAIAASKLEEHDAHTEHRIREDKWDVLEAKLLDRVSTLLPMAELKDANKTLDILSRRRSSNKTADAAMIAAGRPAQQVLVSLNLPEYQREKIISDNVVTTNQGEVIQAGGRALTAMDTDTVMEMLETSKTAVLIDDL